MNGLVSVSDCQFHEENIVHATLERKWAKPFFLAAVDFFP